MGCAGLEQIGFTGQLSAVSSAAAVESGVKAAWAKQSATR